MGPVGQLDAHQKLRESDGGDSYLVIVVDGIVQRSSLPVGVDNERGVEEEPAQGPVSVSSSSRAEAMSPAKLRSGFCRRSTAFTSTPRPVLTGSNCATTLPRLTIVNRSPRCSTASSRSEKFLAASVALTSGIEIRLSDRRSGVLFVENRRKYAGRAPPAASTDRRDACGSTVVAVTRDDVLDFCGRLPGAAEDYPFGDGVAVFKVGGRVFALVSLEGDPGSVNLKCDPELALELRARYSAVRPGYHQDKRHWNTVDLDGSIDKDEFREMIDHSYGLVVAALPRAQRARLSEGVGDGDP